MDIITEQHVIRFLDHDPNILPAVIALPANSHDLVAILVRPLVHQRVVVHDPLIPGGVGGSALNVDAIAKNLMQTRRTVADIISAHTGKSLEEVLDKTASDS